MASDADIETPERSKWSLWAIAAAVLLVMLFGVIAFGTLRGCLFLDPQEVAKREEERKKKEEEEKKKKEEYKIESAVVHPAEPGTPFQYVKPGHWATASQTVTANFRDFVGDSRLTVTNSRNEAYPIAQTPYVLRARRPVLLSTGRPKATETTFHVPQTNQAMQLVMQLDERGLGVPIARPFSPLRQMPSYQYHFVVLAREPARYGYLKALDSVSVPFDGESEADDTEDSLHYRVVPVPVGQTISLPDNPLTWTSIAYLLWDDVDPQSLTPEQQRALVDWLHWGGQIIVNGPSSLDVLAGSFLVEHLPATSGGPRTIGQGDPVLAALNDAWMISTAKVPGETLQPTKPWSAITLDIHEAARALPGTGDLFAERQVGRGRIVVSAIQLAERDLVNWRSGFHSFFNACLLRRPHREYRPGYFGDVTLLWADEEFKHRRLDARLTTTLRFAARDLGVETAYRYEEVRDDEVGLLNQFGQPQILRAYRPSDAPGGIGAWNDFNATATAARQALREAAGVEVPGAGFVVFWLVTYLVVLVPLNWLIFHTLGRVEWAWIAAPLVAIIGTFVVVNQAQLDIGFVRAQTEIGILEQQPDYPRAALSRYTALYTSLSTTYDLEFANLTTLAAPFPTDANFGMLRGQGYRSVDFQRYDSVRLTGLPISSNSTGMVHSEQMMALDAPIRIGQSAASGGRQVENRTRFELHSVCVVRRPAREEAERATRPRQFEGIWIGELLPGQSAPVRERMLNLEPEKPAFASNRADEARLVRTERLNLEPLFQLALDPKHIEPGETRLVARVDEVLPGQAITPAASQVRGATFVIAHLEYAPPEPPQPDVNTRRDVKDVVEEPTEFQLELEPEY